jgi:hypothetical protein
MSDDPTPDITLADLDRDGALEEAAASFLPTSRLEFFRRGILGGGALLGILSLPDEAEAALAKAKPDIAIVNFDIVLEHLQSALYVEAQRLGALSPKTLDWARVVGAHELAHLEALKRMVDRPPARPSFNFGGVTEREARFVKTAVAFEDLTAAILKWQALRLHSREIVAAAATLHSVEMVRLIASTNFITSRPLTTSRRRGPRYTG